MPGTAAENRARLRAKMEKSAGAKRGGVRKVVKKKRSNATATKERALLQVVRKQNMRSMDIEGVTMVKEDESLVTFKEPKLMLAPKGGAFVVQGKAETKTAAEGLAHLLGSMGGSSGFVGAEHGHPGPAASLRHGGRSLREGARGRASATPGGVGIVAKVVVVVVNVIVIVVIIVVVAAATAAAGDCSPERSSS